MMDDQCIHHKYISVELYLDAFKHSHRIGVSGFWREVWNIVPIAIKCMDCKRDISNLQLVLKP